MGRLDPTQKSRTASLQQLEAYARELEQKLEERTRELAETREQLAEALEEQTAASEVLRVISSSPGTLEPVFNAVLANAVRLCVAKFGTLWLAEGDRFRSVAFHDLPPALAKERLREPLVEFAPSTGVGRVVKTKQVVHVDDMSQDPAYLAGNARAVLSRTRGRPHRHVCTDAEGRRGDRCAHHLPPGGPSVHG